MDTITTKVIMDIEANSSDFQKELNLMRSSLSKLKLPSDLKNSLTTTFDKAVKDTETLKTLLAKPSKTDTDIKNIEKLTVSVKEAISGFTNLNSVTSKLKVTDLMNESEIAEFNHLTVAIKKAETELKSLNVTEEQRRKDNQKLLGTQLNKGRGANRLSNLDSQYDILRQSSQKAINRGDFEVAVPELNQMLTIADSITAEKQQELNIEEKNLQVLKSKQTVLESIAKKTDEIATQNALAAAQNKYAKEHGLTILSSGKIQRAKGSNISDAEKNAGINAIKNIDVAKEADQELKTLNKTIDTTENNIDKMVKSLAEISNEKAGIEKIKMTIKDVDKALDQAGDNPELRRELEQLRSSLLKLQTDKIDELNRDMQTTVQQADKVGKEFDSSYGTAARSAVDLNNQQKLLNNQLDNMQSRIAHVFSLSTGFDLLRQSARYAFNSVKELDAAMTEIAVVTDMTIDDLWAQRQDYSDLASSLGTTTLGAFEVAQIYYQQGLSDQEVFDANAETLKFARISNVEYADATDYMTAAIKGFNLEMEDTARVNDVFSALAARSAASQQEIAEALTRTASIANNAGMSLENTSAFLSQMIETTREAPENLGTAMKTIIARFQEMKTSPAELFEVEGEIVDVNKIDTALRSVGVRLKDSENQFRALDDVFLELASKWDTLDGATQRYIATVAAGSRQQSRFIAMMQNYDRTLELTNIAANAEGDADKQFEKTLDSLESKMNKLKNAWEQFVLTLADSTLIKGIVDFLTDLLNGINKITESMGEAGAIFQLALVGGAMAAGRKILIGFISNIGVKFSNMFHQATNDANKFSNSFIGGLDKVSNKMKTVFSKKTWVGKDGLDNLLDGFSKNNKIDLNNIRIGFDNIQTDDFANKFQQAIPKNFDAVEFSKIKDTGLSKYIANNEKLNKILQKNSLFTAANTKAKAAFLAAYQAQIPVQEAAILLTLSEKEATEALTKEKLKEIVTEKNSIATEKAGILTKTKNIALLLLGGQQARKTAAANLGLASSQAIAAGTTSTLTKALLALPLGWILAVIAAIITLTVVLKNYFDATSNEGKLKNLEKIDKSFEEQGKILQDNIAKIEDFQSSIEETYEEINNLVKGSLEWQKAILDVNNQVLDLTKNFSGLYDNVYKDDNGIFHIDEDGLQEVLEKQVKELELNTTIDLYIETQKQAVELDIERENFINEMTNMPFFGDLIHRFDSFNTTGFDNAMLEIAELPFIANYNDINSILSKSVDLSEQEIQRLATILSENGRLIQDYANTVSSANLQMQSGNKLWADSIVEAAGYSTDYSVLLTNMSQNVNKDYEDYSENFVVNTSFRAQKASNLINSIFPTFDETLRDYAAIMGENVRINSSNGDIERLNDNGSWEVDKNITVGEVEDIVMQYKVNAEISTNTDDILNEIKIVENEILNSVNDIDISEYDGFLGRIAGQNITKADADILSELEKSELSKIEEYLENNAIDFGNNFDNYVNEISNKASESFNKIKDNFTEEFKKAGFNENELNEISANFNEDDFGFLSNIAENINTSFDVEASNDFLNSVIELYNNGSQRIKDEFSTLFSDIDYTNAITSLNELKIAAQSTSEEISSGAKGLIAAGGNAYTAAGQFNSLLSQEGWVDVLESISELNEENDKLSPDNLEDMAKESEILSKFLENVEMDLIDISTVLEGLALGDLEMTGITNSLLEAVEIMNGLDKSINSSFETWTNVDLGIDEGEVSEGVITVLQRTTELIDENAYGSEQLKNAFEMLLPKATIDNVMKQHGGNLQLTYDDLYENYLPQIDEDTSNLEPFWDYLIENKKLQSLNLRNDDEGNILLDTGDKTTQELIEIFDRASGYSNDLNQALITELKTKSPTLEAVLGENDYNEAFRVFTDQEESDFSNGISKTIFSEESIYNLAQLSGGTKTELDIYSDIYSNLSGINGISFDNIDEAIQYLERLDVAIVNMKDTVGDSTAIINNLLNTTGSVDQQGYLKSIRTNDGKNGLSVDLYDMQKDISLANPGADLESTNLALESMISQLGEEVILKAGELTIDKDIVDTQGIDAAIDEAWERQDAVELGDTIGDSVHDAIIEAFTSAIEKVEGLLQNLFHKILNPGIATESEEGMKTGNESGVKNSDVSILLPKIFNPTEKGSETGIEAGTLAANLFPLGNKIFTTVYSNALNAINSAMGSSSAPSYGQTNSFSPINTRKEEGGRFEDGGTIGGNSYSKKYPNSKPGNILVGEAGPELVETPTGYFIAGNKGPEVIPVKKGTTIYKNSDTKKILSRRSDKQLKTQTSGTKAASGANIKDIIARLEKTKPKEQSHAHLTTSTSLPNSKYVTSLQPKNVKKPPQAKEDNSIVALYGGSSSGSGSSGGSGGSSGGSGSSSGGSSAPSEPEIWENPYDWLYNLLENINEEIRVREKLEWKYGKILTDNNKTVQDMYENIEAQEDSLKQQLDYYNELKTKRLEEMSRTEGEFSDLAGYGSYDETSGTIDINWDAIEAVTDTTQGERIEEYIGKLEEIQDSIEDAEDSLMDIEDQVEELQNLGKDEYDSLEQAVYDALVQREQDTIDLLSDINQSITTANTDLISTLQSQTSKDREQRESDEARTDIEEQQRRLSLLQQDSSGANALEIFELEKQIEEAQQAYTDSLIDKAISEIQEQNDLTAEQREMNIEILQNQLDWKAENGLFWEEANDLISSAFGLNGKLDSNSQLAKLLKTHQGWAGLSTIGKESWWRDTTESYKSALSWYIQNSDMSQKAGQWINFTDQNGKAQTGIVDTNGSVKGSDGMWYNDVVAMPDGSYKSLSAASSTSSADSSGSNSSSSNVEVDPWAVPRRDHELETYPYGRASDTAKRDLSSQGLVGGDVKAVQWALQGIYGASKLNVTGTYDNLTASTVLQFQRDSGIYGIDAPGAVGWRTRKRFFEYGYKDGGLADYTGPAWLDGTPGKPEMVLNARDTKNFIQLKEILDQGLQSKGITNNNVKGNEINVHIEIDEISNDYDVEQMANKLKEILTNDASYRNTNIINSMR